MHNRADEVVICTSFPHLRNYPRIRRRAVLAANLCVVAYSRTVFFFVTNEKIRAHEAECSCESCLERGTGLSFTLGLSACSKHSIVC